MIYESISWRFGALDIAPDLTAGAARGAVFVLSSTSRKQRYREDEPCPKHCGIVGFFMEGCDAMGLEWMGLEWNGWDGRGIL